MSIAFAKEGAKVILTDIDILGGKEVEDEILNSDGEAVYVEHDVTSAEGWAEVRNIINPAPGVDKNERGHRGYSRDYCREWCGG